VLGIATEKDNQLEFISSFVGMIVNVRLVSQLKAEHIGRILAGGPPYVVMDISQTHLSFPFKNTHISSR
jgi:hypothetical protein